MTNSDHRIAGRGISATRSSGVFDAAGLQTLRLLRAVAKLLLGGVNWLRWVNGKSDYGDVAVGRLVAHDLSLLAMFMRPLATQAQLEEAGFSVKAMFDPEGGELAPKNWQDSGAPWHHVVAREDRLPDFRCPAIRSNRLSPISRQIAMNQSTYIYHFVDGSDSTRNPLVLLHGSGGDGHGLLPLADALAPGSSLLGVRGTVSIDGGYAFFKRFPDRTIDETDLANRVPVLADFIGSAAARYAFTRAPVAIGFSNGAVMAAALLLLRPSLLAGALLFRPLSPFSYDLPTRLDGTRVLIIDGQEDSRRLPGDGRRLAERLIRAGAAVMHHVLPVGHSITEGDREIARDWLAQTP
jgi:phospholipase/carboxylesterase